MNKIHLVGYVSREPELNFISGTGTAVVKFGLAVNRPQFDKSKPQIADFFNCTMFGKRAETIANYVRKGHRFGLSGRVQINKYVDKKTGENRWSTDVILEDFDFLQDKGAKNNANETNETFTDYSEDATLIDDEGDIPF